MKNPNNNPLRIVGGPFCARSEFGLILSNLAIAEAQLVAAGKASALPHFIAIVKRIEALYGFHFEQVPDVQE